jgi:hypothetical protein
VHNTDRAATAATFVRSESVARATTWDLHRREEVPVLHAALIVNCPELGRAARALELVEREVRRCGRAWGAAWDESSLLNAEDMFSAPDWFLDSLQRFPRPTPHGALGDIGSGRAPALGACATSR